MNNIFLQKQKEANAEIGKVENFERDFFIFAYSGDISYHVNTEGSMVIKLNVTLKNVPNLSCGSKKEEFKKASTNELVKHFATLLNEDSRGDITIISKDDGKLYAHKAILRGNMNRFHDLNCTSKSLLQEKYALYYICSKMSSFCFNVPI